jgi:hypothetical protein
MAQETAPWTPDAVVDIGPVDVNPVVPRPDDSSPVEPKGGCDGSPLSQAWVAQQQVWSANAQSWTRGTVWVANENWIANQPANEWRVANATANAAQNSWAAVNNVWVADNAPSVTSVSKGWTTEWTSISNEWIANRNEASLPEKSGWLSYRAVWTRSNTKALRDAFGWIPNAARWQRIGREMDAWLAAPAAGNKSTVEWVLAAANASWTASNSGWQVSNSLMQSNENTWTSWVRINDRSEGLWTALNGRWEVTRRGKGANDALASWTELNSNWTSDSGLWESNENAWQKLTTDQHVLTRGWTATNGAWEKLGRSWTSGISANENWTSNERATFVWTVANAGWSAASTTWVTANGFWTSPSNVEASGWAWAASCNVNGAPTQDWTSVVE